MVYRDVAIDFGSMVRTYRHAAGLTQFQLAEKAGISVAALRDLEQSRRHRPRPSTIDALSGALSLNADQAASLANAAASRHRIDAAATPPRHAGDRRTPGPAEPFHGLWLAALGPLEAWRDGSPLPLGPPVRRAVLGQLLVDPGTLVRRDTMVDVLWGEAPPRTAVVLVQAHVSRIRKLLDPSKCSKPGEGVISSVRGAYRLNLSHDQLDLLVFRDLAARAATAWASGDVAAAVECYEQAIALWRGDPLADLEALYGYPGVTALRQELVGVLLRYAEVACEAGLHFRVLPRLRALANAEPLNERVHAQLMIALAGCGQQAAAIRVYQGVRASLDRELGLYPGEELTVAYLRVLRQDIASGKSGRAPKPRLARGDGMHVVPRQLPIGPRYFTGRARELATLSNLLGREVGQGDRVSIVAVTGMAGIGKTALAVYWAHQVASRFPDGQLFVNLRGFGPSGAPVEAVHGFLVALGVPPQRIPADPDEQNGLYRSLLADRCMLILLDNAQDAEQVRPLLPGSPGCLVLVTSRNRLTGLAAAEGAHLLDLAVLTAYESRALLSASVGAERAMAEPGAISELIELCACLPLALRDVAARAVARPYVPLAALAAEMRGTRGRLDALETGEPATSVRMVFSWSRARLRAPASRMFRLLGIHPGPDIAVPAAASLTGMSREQAYIAMAELCEEHLLTEYPPGRYVLHELLRAYAAERAQTSYSDTERRAAVHRVLDYYLRAAIVASSFLHPNEAQLLKGRPQPGVVHDEISGPGQAAEWVANERDTLLAAISLAVEGEYSPHAWELPWAAGWLFHDKASWRSLAVAQESALAFATRIGNLAGQVIARQHLGWLSFLLGDLVSADHHLDEAAELASQLGDGRLRARGEVHALYTIGAHLLQLGHCQQAARFSSCALMAYRQSICR